MNKLSEELRQLRNCKEDISNIIQQGQAIQFNDIIIPKENKTPHIISISILRAKSIPKRKKYSLLIFSFSR